VTPDVARPGARAGRDGAAGSPPHGLPGPPRLDQHTRTDAACDPGTAVVVPEPAQRSAWMRTPRADRLVARGGFEVSTEALTRSNPARSAARPRPARPADRRRDVPRWAKSASRLSIARTLAPVALGLLLNALEARVVVRGPLEVGESDLVAGERVVAGTRPTSVAGSRSPCSSSTSMPGRNCSTSQGAEGQSTPSCSPARRASSLANR